jgi:hypothetical protein
MKKSKEENVLIIAASGGAGLLVAAQAKGQEIKKINPKANVFFQDFMLEWSWKWLGRFGVFAWNWAQQTGNVWSQEVLAGFQKIAEILLWPRVFFTVKRILFEKQIDRVFDSQPLGNSAILQAIRIYNKQCNKQIKLEKIVVDLPTAKSSHFFHSVKKLPKESRDLIRLITIEPLLDVYKSDEEFWLHYCNLPLSQISYEKYVIRQEFREKMQKEKTVKTEKVFIRYKIAKEALMLKKLFKESGLLFSSQKNRLHFSVPGDAIVITILLGSHPSLRGTFGYIKNLLSSIPSCKKEVFVFAFCGDSKDQEGLFSQVVSFVRKKGLPKNLKVIPMSYQQEDVISELFSRSDATLTRVGGQTAMELMAMEVKNIWIHSEAKESSSLEELLKGIPAWEAGNAIYLCEKHKAKVVTPATFMQPLIKLLQKKKACKKLVED